LAIAIRDFEAFGFTANTDPQTLNTSALSWVSGDYVLVFWGASGGTTTTTAAGGTDDTYASIRLDEVTNSHLNAFEGTINGGAFDASIVFDQSTTRRSAVCAITFSGALGNASQPNAHTGDFT
jgi:hypothetical protein